MTDRSTIELPEHRSRLGGELTFRLLQNRVWQFDSSAMARHAGIEPTSTVLETVALPLS